MSASMVRAGATAALLAAGAFLLSAALGLVLPLDVTVDSPAEVGYRGLTVVAFVGVIIAVLGLHARHRGSDRYGRWGTVAAVITIAGYAIMALLTVVAMFADVEYLLTVRIVDAGVLLLGCALLGIVIIRARVLPWWWGALLIVAFPLGHFANAIFPVVENLLFALLWGSLGLLLLRSGAEDRIALSAQAVGR